MAEWLNAADCNFVPRGTKVRILPTPDEVKSEKESKRKLKIKMKGRKKGVEVNKERRKRRIVTKLTGREKTENRKKEGESKYHRREKPKRIVPQYVIGVPRMPLRTSEKALQKLYGVGRNKALEVCRACGRSPIVKVGNRENEHVRVMERWRIENVLCGSDRRRIEYESVSRHLKLGTVRGMNMRRGLPVRGQRTSTNGMTARKLNVQRGMKVNK